MSDGTFDPDVFDPDVFDSGVFDVLSGARVISVNVSATPDQSIEVSTAVYLIEVS